MNDEHDLRPEDRAALEALGRPGPAPRDEARRRTREMFLAEGTQSAPRRAAGPTPSLQLWRPAAAVVVTAVAALVLWVGSMPQGEWILNNVDGPSEIRRDGETVARNLGEPFGNGLIAVGDSTEIELAWGELLLRLREDTEAQLPPPPGRFFLRGRTIEVTSGEVYGSSGDAELGFPLTLSTPEATAELTGTTFAVFRTDDATCFCLYRGGLDVTPRDGETFPLPVGNRVFIYKDGRPPEFGPLDAGETMKLRMIDDSALGN